MPLPLPGRRVGGGAHALAGMARCGGIQQTGVWAVCGGGKVWKGRPRGGRAAVVAGVRRCVRACCGGRQAAEQVEQR